MKRRFTGGAVLAALIAVGAITYAFAAPGAGAARASASAARSALSMNILVTGQKQGVITRGSPAPVLSVSHEIVSPRDPASGLPTGKRQHMPISVTMQWGAATPKLITALTTNENLTSVQINLLRGGSKVATIKLTNASVSDYVQTDQTFTCSFTYQHISWTWVSGGITSEDDWQAPST